MLFEPWCDDCGCPPADTVACGGECQLPKHDLSMRWTNVLLGSRIVALEFDGVDSWVSACTNQLIFRLTCNAGGPVFSATAFVGGPCPTGSPVSCTSPGSSPSGLTMTSYTCDPLSIKFSTTGCPALAAQGYTEFEVTGDGVPGGDSVSFSIAVRGCFGSPCKFARVGDPELISSPATLTEGTWDFTLAPGTSITVYVWHPGYVDPIERTFSLSADGTPSWSEDDLIFQFENADLKSDFVCPLWYREEDPPGDPWKLPLLVTDSQNSAALSNGPTRITDCVEREADPVGATCDVVSTSCPGPSTRDNPPAVGPGTLEMRYRLAADGGGGHLGGDVWSWKLFQICRINGIVVYNSAGPCAFGEDSLASRSWYCPTLCDAEPGDTRIREFASGNMAVTSYSPLAATFAFPAVDLGPYPNAWLNSDPDLVMVLLQPPPGDKVFSSAVLSSTPYT